MLRTWTEAGYALHNEKYLEFLRSKNRPHQLLLEAWSCIEFNIDQVVTRQFGINCEYFDKKVQFLVNSSFGRKLDLLKKLGILDLDEYQTIHKFQEERNKFLNTYSTESDQIRENSITILCATLEREA